MARLEILITGWKPAPAALCNRLPDDVQDARVHHGGQLADARPT